MAFKIQVKNAQGEMVNLPLAAETVPWSGVSGKQNATDSAAGLMSAADKTKLDGITAGANKYTLPIATASVLGGVKSSTTGTTSGRDYKVQVNSDGTMKVNVPWANTTYSAATQSAAGLMSAGDKAKLDGITASADAVSFSRSLNSGTKIGTITINGTATDLFCQTNTDTKYSQATSSTLGLVKIGYSTNGKNYAVQLDSSGKMYVNVPWANTTYSAGTGLTLRGTTFALSTPVAVANGGTGMTSNPSMLINLASGSAASVFAASPRPGVTGTLPVSRGGTGVTSLKNLSVVEDIGYDVSGDRAKPVTMQAIAYWNGAYQSTTSNLRYCNGGEIVGTTNAQTISGAKTFTGNNIIKANFLRTAGAGNYKYFDFLDSGNNRMGIVGAATAASRYYGVYMQAGNEGALGIYSNGSSVYTTAPTPAASDNSTKIATTAWVRNCVSNNAGITPLGVMNFTSSGAYYTGGYNRAQIFLIRPTTGDGVYFGLTEQDEEGVNVYIKPTTSFTGSANVYRIG